MNLFAICFMCLKVSGRKNTSLPIALTITGDLMFFLPLTT